MNGIETLISFNAILIPSAIAPEVPEPCYTTLVFYKQIPNSVNVDLAFVIVHNLQPVLEVKKMYIIINI